MVKFIVRRIRNCRLSIMPNILGYDFDNLVYGIADIHHSDILKRGCLKSRQEEPSRLAVRKQSHECKDSYELNLASKS